MQLFLLTALTMIAFAANSVLARLALAENDMSAGDYSLVRLAFGAAMLVVLSQGRNALRFSQVLKSGGTWASSVALLVYVVGFSFAYLALDTGMGALILFACVQATMIGWGLIKGNRPSMLEWLGIIIAFSAFVYLVSPGLEAPNPLGTVLMVAAGIAWGIYSLRGAGSTNALADTAGNFLRATLVMIPLAVGLSAWQSGSLNAIASQDYTLFGFAMAAISGAVTSGLGYALWYRCLPQLSTTRAAIVQLSVPAIATLGGIIFAGEDATLRLLLCSALILGGIAIAISARQKSA